MGWSTVVPREGGRVLLLRGDWAAVLPWLWNPAETIRSVLALHCLPLMMNEEGVWVCMSA